jgi:hypothetical protein
MFGMDKVWEEQADQQNQNDRRLSQLESGAFSLLNALHLSTNQSENVVKGTTSTVVIAGIPAYAKGIFVVVGWDTQATAFELWFGPTGETLDTYSPKAIVPASFVASTLLIVPVTNSSIDIEVSTAAGAMTVATSLTVIGYWT